jgi:hypothetical protein
LREVEGKKGSLQVWLENAISEESRSKDKISAPNPRRWLYERQTMNLFDSLVYDDDRNLGNVLYDRQWKLWMINATRSFQAKPELKNPDKVHYCERGLWDRIQKLDEAEIRETLQDTGLLTSGEVRNLLKRQQKLIEHIQKLIETRGEAWVLFQF